jgi:hypothetical protein
LAGLIVLGVLGVAAPQARSQDPSPTFLGLPEFYSQSLDLSFYFDAHRAHADTAIRNAIDAIKLCSRENYDNARKILENIIRDLASVVTTTAESASRRGGFPATEGRNRLINHDIAQMQKALEKFPPFPEDCKDKRVGVLPGSLPAGSGPVFIGTPDYYAASADLGFFSESLARQVNTYYGLGEEAARECNRQGFELSRIRLEDMIARATQDYTKRATEASRGSTIPGVSDARAIDLRQLRHDIAQIQRALDKLGKFEDRCPKEKKVGALFDVFIQGGAALAFQSSGFFRALDTFSEETPTVFGGNTRSTGVFGGGVRVNVLKINPTFFFETRFQTAFGAPSFQQTAGLSGANAPGQAPFGESLVRENWGIPLVLGSTWSLGNVGGLGELGLDVYGGITIANWTQSLAGGEAGVPGTPTYSARQTKTSVDPTFGIGLRLPVGDFNGDGRADVILGVYGEFAFRQGSSVTAISPSNGGLTYTGWVDSRTTGSLMLRLSVPLGGGPLFRAD